MPLGYDSRLLYREMKRYVASGWAPRVAQEKDAIAAALLND
jgi:hypothetical protein